MEVEKFGNLVICFKPSPSPFPIQKNLANIMSRKFYLKKRQTSKALRKMLSNWFRKS